MNPDLYDPWSVPTLLHNYEITFSYTEDNARVLYTRQVQAFNTEEALRDAVCDALADTVCGGLAQAAVRSGTISLRRM